MRPQLSTRSNLHVRKVLLIDQATPEARAAILRSHSVEVHEATEMTHAHYLWRPNVYGLVMLDVRRYPPGETIEFYEQIRDASPGQRFVFLLGPPRYVSRTWPAETGVDDSSRGQWAETMKRFTAAA